MGERTCTAKRLAGRLTRSTECGRWKREGRSHYGSALSVCVFNDDKVRDAPQGMNEERGVEKNVGKRYKKLFQITEAAHACGLSRSTLMRMEERDCSRLALPVER